MKLSAKLTQRICVVATLALFAILIGGCNTVRTFNDRHDTTIGKKRKVENVYQVETLPKHLRRVALLPIHLGRYDHIEMDTIEENFRQEITKRNLFEVVPVTVETMQELFGEKSYSSQEHLPTKLLSKLHTMYAIDGVMLIDISYFNAYQPVGMGVRVKLLDGHTGEIVWAADELFDAANPAVSNAARKYYQKTSVSQYPLHETQTILQSTTRFSKYVAQAIFSTIQ